MVWGFLPNKLKKKSCKIPAHDLEKQTPPRKQCCPKQEWGGRTLAGVGIHFLKDCSIKKTKAVRKWEAGAETGGDEGLPPGCPTSVSEKRRESRRSTGDGHGPGVGPLGTAGDADAVAAHAFPWGQARTPGGASPHTCVLYLLALSQGTVTDLIQNQL